MTEREDDIFALALGRMLLQYGKVLDFKALAERIKCDAEKCLLDILEILNREELSDFACIEEITRRIEKMGLDTWRHDFG